VTRDQIERNADSDLVDTDQCHQARFEGVDPGYEYLTEYEAWAGFLFAYYFAWFALNKITKSDQPFLFLESGYLAMSEEEGI